MSIDLHIHSTNSDGSNTIAEIIKKSKDLQLQAISITDHEYLTTVQPEEGLEIIPGVEISVAWEDLDKENIFSGTHLLVYFITKDSEINNHLESIRVKKIERNYEIIDNLKLLGVEIKKEDLDMYETKVPGRPHIAELLVKNNYVKNIPEAFGKYLGNGQLKDINKHQEDIITIIDLAKSSNCLVFLAHPHTLMSDSKYSRNNNWINNKFYELISELSSYGLDGIETFYPGYSVSNIDKLKKIAIDNNLLMSGGSDFHGDKKPKNQLGIGYEDSPINVPYELLNSMKQRQAHI